MACSTPFLSFVGCLPMFRLFMYPCMHYFLMLPFLPTCTPDSPHAAPAAAVQWPTRRHARRSGGAGHHVGPACGVFSVGSAPSESRGGPSQVTHPPHHRGGEQWVGGWINLLCLICRQVGGSSGFKKAAVIAIVECSLLRHLIFYHTRTAARS